MEADWLKKLLAERVYEGAAAPDDTYVPVRLGDLRRLAKQLWGDEERFWEVVDKNTLGGARPPGDGQ